MLLKYICELCGVACYLHPLVCVVTIEGLSKLQWTGDTHETKHKRCTITDKIERVVQKITVQNKKYKRKRGKKEKKTVVSGNILKVFRLLQCDNFLGGYFTM